MASPFKMKGSPYKAETSPLKQWYIPWNKEVKSKRVDEKSFAGFSDHDEGGDPYSTEKKSRTYQNRFTGDQTVKTTETKKSGGPGDFGGSRTDTKKTTTKFDKTKHGEQKYKSQTVKNKTKIKGAAVGGNMKWGDKTKTTDTSKFEDDGSTGTSYKYNKDGTKKK